MMSTLLFLSVVLLYSTPCLMWRAFLGKKHHLPSKISMANFGQGLGLDTSPVSIASSPASLASIEIYACQAENVEFVVSQISNWVRSEQFTLQDKAYYSTILASLDGTRIAHVIGWKPKALNTIEKIFEELRKRGDTTDDGSPVNLKESTHLYQANFTLPGSNELIFPSLDPDSYDNLYSLDLFNLHHIDKIHDVCDIVKNSIKNTATDPMLADNKGFHVFTSVDSIVCAMIGIWNRNQPEAFDLFCSSTNVQEMKAQLKKICVQGTMTDIIEKKDPFRLYTVVDVFA